MIIKNHNYKLKYFNIEKFKQYIYLIFILAILIIFYLLPENIIFDASHLNSCFHQTILGFNCPGCGMTRASYLLLHLEIKNAIQLQPCVLFIIPILLTETLKIIKPTNLAKKILIKTYLSFFGSLFINYLIKIYENLNI